MTASKVEELLWLLSACDAVSEEDPLPACRDLGLQQGVLVEGLGTAAQAYVGRDRDRHVVAVRGSGGHGVAETLSNAMLDLTAYRLGALDLEPEAKVHTGALWHAASIVHRTLDALAGAERVVVTGFSLGASAGLLLALFLEQELSVPVSVVGFGGFRPGDACLAELVDRRLDEVQWVELPGDIATRFPPGRRYCRPGPRLALPPLRRRLVRREHLRPAYREALLQALGGRHAG